MASEIDQIVTVRLNNVDDAMSGESKQLRFRISKPPTSGTDKYTVELSDELAVGFIYRLKLTCTEFEQMKKTFRIGVDFDQFIPHVQKLINDLSNDGQFTLECTLKRTANVEVCKLDFIMVVRSTGVCLLTLELHRVVGDELVNYLIKTMEFYRMQYHELQTSKKSVKHSYEKLSKENKQLDLENKQLREDKNMLVESVSKLDTDYSALKDKYEDLEDEFDIIKEDTSSKNQRIHDLELDLQDEKLTLQHRDEDLERCQDKFDELCKENEELRTAYFELEDLLKKVAEKGRKREDNVVHLRNALKSLHDDKDDILDELDEVKAALATVTRRNDELLQKVAELEKRVEHEVAVNVSLQTQLEIKNKKLETRKENENQKPVQAPAVPKKPLQARTIR